MIHNIIHKQIQRNNYTFGFVLSREYNDHNHFKMYCMSYKIFLSLVKTTLWTEKMERQYYQSNIIRKGTYLQLVTHSLDIIYRMQLSFTFQLVVHFCFYFSSILLNFSSQLFLESSDYIWCLIRANVSKPGDPSKCQDLVCSWC